MARSDDTEASRLERLIADRQKEVLRIRDEVDRLPALENDLHALVRARDLMQAGPKKFSIRIGGKPIRRLAPLPAKPAQQQIPISPTAVHEPSIPEFAATILRDANRPLHAKEIREEFKRRGRDVKMLSLVGALHRATNAKGLRFLGKNVFALPAVAAP